MSLTLIRLPSGNFINANHITEVIQEGEELYVWTQLVHHIETLDDRKTYTRRLCWTYYGDDAKAILEYLEQHWKAQLSVKP